MLTHRTAPVALAFGLAAVLAPGCGRAEPAAPGFACTGNEPGWRLDITGETATFQSMLIDGTQTLAGTLTSLDYLDPALTVWRAEGGDADGPLVAVMTEGACFDTMADGPALTHRAVVSRTQDSVLAGCCNATP